MNLTLRKKIIFSLFKLFFIFTIIIIIGEIVVRYFNLGDPNTKYLYNNQIPKRLPHYKFTNFKENINIVLLNNHGFHDTDRETKNDKYRYGFLGDSIVEGVQVDRDSLFTNHLNRLYKNNKMNVEVLNFGMSGSGTTYQYKLWEKYIKTQFDLNHIVLCFYLGNDLENNSLYLDGPKENFSYYIDSTGSVLLYGKGYGIIRKLIVKLNNYSAFTNTIYQRLYLLKRIILKRRIHAQKQLAESNIDTNNINKGNVHEIWTQTIQGTMNLINQWNIELISKGKKLSILLIHPAEYYEDENNYYSSNKLLFKSNLVKFCNYNNVKLLQIKFENNYQKYYWPHWKHTDSWGHYNYLGHREVANQIYNFLEF